MKNLSIAALGSALLVALSASPAIAATYTVTSTADTEDAGTLRWAINQANADPGSTIQLEDHLGTITLSSFLPLITQAVTISGGMGNTISGDTLHRIFFIDTADSSAAVNISNLSLGNGLAKGGAGGAGGGGGGLGAGGAIFVNSGAVTISGVTFYNNAAVGGAGGVGGGGSDSTIPQSGGGGGLGGAGGSGVLGAAGGGGGFMGAGGNGAPTSSAAGGGGFTGNGGNGSLVMGSGGSGGGGLTDGSVATTAAGGAGGIGGGQGGDASWSATPTPSWTPIGRDGGLYGGGGGAGGSEGGLENGGNGGKFGGGGGGGRNRDSRGGNGGDFGGGGGATGQQGYRTYAGSGGWGGGGGGGAIPHLSGYGGAGGFGGGGGGSFMAVVQGGYLGGASVYVTHNLNFSISGGGGGGAAGGNIFVRSETGGSLTIIDGAMWDGRVTGGAGGMGGPQGMTASASGVGAGSSLFLDGGTTTIQVSSGTMTLAGSIADASPGGYTAATLAKTGAGTLILQGSNSYAGGTILSAGTLRLGSRGAIGSSGTITFNGGTLQATWTNTDDYSSRFSQAAGQLYRIDTNGASMALSTNLASSGGSLTKMGDGTLWLSGSNTFSGGTEINGGNISVGSAGALGTTGTISFGGGAIRFTEANTTDYSGRFNTAAGQQYAFDTNWQDVAFATGLTSSDGSVVKTGFGTLTISGSNAYSGSTTIAQGTLRLENGSRSSSFNIASGAVLELAPAADYAASTTFSGAGTLRKSGGISARWAGPAATFALDSGSLIDVQGGTFVGGSNGNEVWTHNKSNLNVAAGAIFNGVEANVRVNALSGSGTIRSGFTSPGYQNFTFGVDNGSGTFAGTLANNPGYAGNYVKTGTGTQTLTGTSAYTGSTTVEDGTLMVHGDISSSSGISVEDGAILGGSGTVSDVIVRSGGTLSPGASPGLLTIDGDLTFEAGSNLILEFSASGFDQISVTGSFTAGGTLSLQVDGSFKPVKGAEFLVFTSGGYDAGSFSINFGSDLGGDLFWDDSKLASMGIISVVPEPGVYALGGFGLSILLFRARRFLRGGLGNAQKHSHL